MAKALNFGKNEDKIREFILKVDTEAYQRGIKVGYEAGYEDKIRS